MTKADGSDTRSSWATGSNFSLLLLVAAILLVYRPGLRGGFIFDDFQNLLENPALRVNDLHWSSWLSAMFSSPASDLQRPVAMLSFAVNHYFTGFDPWPMKLTNLLIHTLNACLAYFLVERIARTASPESGRRASWLALLVASCWALHPINLMVVLYVVQRMEGLSHTFVLLGLLIYVLGRSLQIAGRKGWGYVIAGLVPCTVVGMLTKESAALLPLYAFAIEFFVFRFRFSSSEGSRRLWYMFIAVLWIPALLGGAWLLRRSLAPWAYSSRDFSLAERLSTQCNVIMDYLQWSLLPNIGQLSLYHDDYPISHGLLDPPGTLGSLLVLIFLAGVAWLFRKQMPLVALGISWFFSAHLLTGTFIPLELVFEHRNYFASLGVCLAVGALLVPGNATRSRAALGFGVGAALLLFLSAGTYLRSSEWQDPLRFAESEATKHPRSPRATYELARTYIILSRYNAASPFTTRAWAALSTALAAPGSGALPNQAALILAARTGKPSRKSWWIDLQRKLREKPATAENQLSLVALTNCAVESDCDFSPDDMMGTFAAALESGPNGGVLSLFGKYALHELHDPAFALSLWREASALEPANAQFRVNLATLLIDLGMEAEARAQINALNSLGRFNQYGAAARDLEIRILKRSKSAVSGKLEGNSEGVKEESRQ